MLIIRKNITQKMVRPLLLAIVLTLLSPVFGLIDAGVRMQLRQGEAVVAQNMSPPLSLKTDLIMELFE